MKYLIYIILFFVVISCTNKQSSNTSNEGTTQSSYEQETQDVYTSETTSVTPTESSTDFEPLIATNTTENSYSAYSGESNSENTNQYSNYEETDNCVDGVVVYEGQDDYYIIETKRGLTICETYSGWLSEGDKVRGELNKYNFKYILNKDRNSEVRIYIEDYMLSEESALRWLGEHNHLKNREQDNYNSNN